MMQGHHVMPWILPAVALVLVIASFTGTGTGMGGLGLFSHILWSYAIIASLVAGLIWALLRAAQQDTTLPPR